MNAQLQEESKIVRENRAEYIRKARESCIANYYGDQMQSRDQIIKELALKKKREEESIRAKMSEHYDRKESFNSVIPFEEERQRRAEKNHQFIGEELMNADTINRKLASEKTIQLDKITKSVNSLLNQNTSDELLDNSTEVVHEENVPEVQDILKMSGIIEEKENALQNDYVTEFAQIYHENEPTNFLTSIRNADPKESVGEESENENKKESVSDDGKEPFHVFAIRWIFAFIVLATIILFDKFHISVGEVNSKLIYEKMMSNELAEQVEEYMIHFSEK